MTSWCCTSSGPRAERRGIKRAWTFPSPKNKRPSARSPASSSSTAPPRNISPSWNRGGSPRPSAVARTGFVGSAGHRVARVCRRQRRRLPRTRRATRRGRLERRACSRLRDAGAWRGYDCATRRLGDSAAVPAEVVDGSAILTAALAEQGNSDPTAPRTTARADGDTWRSWTAARNLCPQHSLQTPSWSRRRPMTARACSSSRRATAGVIVTPASTTNGEPYADVELAGAVGHRLTEPAARTLSIRSTPGRSSGCARCRSAWPNAR